MATPALFAWGASALVTWALPIAWPVEMNFITGGLLVGSLTGDAIAHARRHDEAWARERERLSGQ